MFVSPTSGCISFGPDTHHFRGSTPNTHRGHFEKMWKCNSINKSHELGVPRVNLRKISVLMISGGSDGGSSAEESRWSVSFFA